MTIHPHRTVALALWAVIVSLLSACGGSQSTEPPTSPTSARPEPPVAEQVPFTQTVNGVSWEDEYYWLNDRENPAVLAYLEAENAYTDDLTGHTEALREALYEEMLGRIQETDLSVPFRDGDYWYYTRTEEGRDYEIHCRKAGNLNAEEEILLDENLLAADEEYFSLGEAEVSPDHDVLAYAADTTGNELHDLHFRDLRSGEDRAEVIEDVYYGLAWANDSQTIFYTTVDEAHRPFRLWRYVLGSDPSEAEMVHEEEDERFYVQVGRTRSDAFVVLDLSSAITTEQWVLDANDPSGAFRVLAPREQGVEYQLEHHGERFFIVTNQSDEPGGAVNFRLVEAPLDSSDRSGWTDVIAHRENVQLVGVDAFADHLVIYEREAGLPRLRIRELSSGDEHYIAFPEPTYDAYAGTNAEFDTQVLRFSYASLVTPRSVFDYDMTTRERELLKEQPVLGGYDRSAYVSERLTATADDGTEVPISLVYRDGLQLDGSNPTWLTGYGSYGYPYDVYFSSHRLSLLDRGFVFAIAHIRGGGEMGRPWYEDGKLLHKRNTFTDFIACAEHLIAGGYTSPEHLAINGGSAGGLLMGAVTNLRPDLFAVVVAEVPFVDVLTTMLDETIPLTVIEWEEWGNPNEPEYFEYMRSYSPYDNVAQADYPDMLITAGLNDPRVGYWEAAKWTARLRARATGDGLIVLRTNMGAGHFGASGRRGRLEELAFEFAFVLDRLGIE